MKIIIFINLIAFVTNNISYLMGCTVTTTLPYNCEPINVKQKSSFSVVIPSIQTPINFSDFIKCHILTTGDFHVMLEAFHSLVWSSMINAHDEAKDILHNYRPHKHSYRDSDDNYRGAVACDGKTCLLPNEEIIIELKNLPTHVTCRFIRPDITDGIDVIIPLHVLLLGTLIGETNQRSHDVWLNSNQSLTYFAWVNTVLAKTKFAETLFYIEYFYNDLMFFGIKIKPPVDMYHLERHAIAKQNNMIMPPPLKI
ncbi:MAG: hypothetical protein Edafosvirus33_7 [Edafosvirus sp.]|uniref:Uncharacterized protein n=1 Tax=Edafosvirus sp. TaxID=2487765 RepID=A0A3G4ZV65_9VIRU|nr:MAG: hypothetical protein Edafosvirus33_7 [Edafosvirus sp.]